MHHLDRTLPRLADNLALDEALLLDADVGRGGEVLRFWVWPDYAVVLGAGGVIADDVIEPTCAADGIPLMRRASGGGTVVIGPGCLNYALVLDTHRVPELQQITSSYRYISAKMAAALADIQPGVDLSGSSDLTIDGQKFSGTAQQRKRRFILHHGTLLHAFDFARIERYLRLPPRRPDYRGDRPHRDFLTNLPDRADDLRTALRDAWGAADALPDWPADLVRTLVEEKYSRPDWVRRR